MLNSHSGRADIPVRRCLKKITSDDNTLGNVLIIGVMAMIILTLFGVTLVSRMVIDAHTSANRVVATEAFYLADGGIQWGRRYLHNGNSANTTLGPMNFGNGTVTVTVQRTSIRYPTVTLLGNHPDVYIITSTATVKGTTRQIEEIRYRGGGTDKDFLLWREAVADEF